MSSASSFLTVRVNARTVEAVDICSYELVEAQGRPLPAFSAGAHIDVHLGDGLTRQYSLCNDPSESHRYLIAVLRDANSRGGSRQMHDGVNVGDTLTISTPKNHFALAHGAKHSVLLAGGIGITPILCMAERLACLGAEFQLHYCTRSQARMAFFDRIRTSPYASRVSLHFDDGDAAQALDLGTVLAQPSEGTHLYVCGPRGFMDAVLGGARTSGWHETSLHYEFFSGDVAKSATDRSFQVKLASSGKVVHIPADKTVVEALGEAGVTIMTSCGEGVCGTCLTRVLEGEIDHKDLYLLPDEQAMNDQFLPCCSRAKSDLLVLDL